MAANISEEPTNQEVLDAIDVLKRAGINLKVDGTSFPREVETSKEETLPVQSVEKKQINPSDYVNPEYETINMMLGGNNNNNNDPMTNLLPYLMNQNGEGKNIDPQVLQSIMMNSMMNSLNGLNSTDNK